MPCAVRLLPRCALQSYFVNYPPSSTRVHGLLKLQPLSLFPLSFTGRLKPARESKRSSGSGNGADSRDHPAINNHLCRAINEGSASGARERDRNGIENLQGRSGKSQRYKRRCIHSAAQQPISDGAVIVSDRSRGSRDDRARQRSRREETPSGVPRKSFRAI